MPFIVFNTIAKAKHYVKYRNKTTLDDQDNTTLFFISGDKVLVSHTYQWFCGSSEPENGYICCSDYCTDIIVIGRIKKLSK